MFILFLCNITVHVWYPRVGEYTSHIEFKINNICIMFAVIDGFIYVCLKLFFRKGTVDVCASLRTSLDTQLTWVMLIMGYLSWK